MIRVTRVYKFAASHRLHSDQLSDAANDELYGKCNNPFGHGHNYQLHVSIRGPVGPSGRAVDIGALDDLVQEHVLKSINHRDLNADVPEFLSLVPTTENLARVIESRLRTEWDARHEPAILDRIYIQETPRNAFELRSSQPVK